MESYKDDKQEILKALGKGLLISFIMTILILLIFSIILTFTNISEKTIVPVIIISTAISILIGSSISNIRIKKNGILNGALIGGGYILILYLLSSILNARFNLNIQSIIMISVGVVFGILGGIIGVNKR
jgi:putative membrane protein (TIGR04086 family)